MKAGAIDFIEKPFEEGAILGSIRRALDIGNNSILERRAQDGPKVSLADDLKANIRDLTPRECDVLNEVVGGRSTKEIAFELKISPKTVEVHRARVMQKMKARSLAHLIRMALAVGIDVGWA